MLDWTDQQDAIFYRIAGTPSLLKILLKTKDDPFFLERWINHHARICGITNLIVFDNMSTDSKVIEILERVSDQVTVIRFTGLHNNVHDVNIFPILYKALAEATRYFCFLDTDEYLVYCDETDGIKLRDISDILLYSEYNIYPGIWLYNLAGVDDVFLVGSSDKTLSDGLTWGKPIIKAQLPLNGFINHNIQLPKAMFGPRVNSRFLVLHLAQLLPEQRIRANINKLIARGFAKPGESVETILSRTASAGRDPNVNQYLTELRRIVLQGFVAPDASILLPGQIKIHVGEKIGFGSEADAIRFNRFVGHNCDVTRDVLELSAKPE